MVTTSMTSYWAINNTQNFQDKKYVGSKLMLITRELKKPPKNKHCVSLVSLRIIESGDQWNCDSSQPYSGPCQTTDNPVVVSSPSM